MKFLLFFLFALSIQARPIESDFRLDLNHDYEYEKGGVKTKFSDWVPYKLHKWDPKFLEDFYELYSLDLHYKEDDLKKDIYFMKVGLASKFRHPRNALCEIKSEEHYYKYRLLVTMHMNLQIMRSYMRIASQYDKRHLYFQNLDFAHELKNSFAIAKTYYTEAIGFWKKAKEDAFKANKSKKELDLGTLESESFEIVKGKLNYEVIINDHLERLDKKQKSVDVYLKENPAADKPLLEIGDEEKGEKKTE